MKELTEDQKVLYSLADTMSKTRDELDALRIVTQAAIATLCARPELRPVFMAALSGAIEGDAAIALNSQMTDAQLERRAKWIARLVPKPPTPAS